MYLIIPVITVNTLNTPGILDLDLFLDPWILDLDPEILDLDPEILDLDP